MTDKIIIKGARANNLKNIDLELPRDKQDLDRTTQQLTHRAKALIKDLSHINLEIAQMVVSSDDDKVLPEWFMVEIVRDLPRLVKKGG